MTSVALLALLLLAVPAAAQTRVSTIQEAIERWSPATHVYVMGDVGLEPAALSELESWLAGGHWTVLLVGDASGQAFQDVNGVEHQGVDAIEYGIGQGITRAAGFAAQAHPKTGEPDGTILSIVLAQRALNYTGSKAQDDRALGEAVFVGNLDRWAIEVMRNGGDIAAAVRNTATNVDGLLTAEIERLPREAREAIASAEEAVKSLEQVAAALRAGPSHPTGRLAHPDTRPLHEDLDRARAQVDADPAAARELALDVLRRTGALHEPIRQSEMAAPRLDDGWRKYRALYKRGRSEVATEPLEGARAGLVEGEALYRNADPAYAARLDQALQDLSRAEEEIGAADAEASYRSMMRFLGIFFLLLVLLMLHIWRYGARDDAEALLASWETALDRKLEALFGELEEKVAHFAARASGGGQGEETESLAASVRADVGALVILWTSARSVLEKARELIRPRRTGAWLINLFSARRYRQGIALLRDEPVPFDPAEGLPRFFGEGEHGWREDLLGDLRSYEPFRKSFEELMAEFHTRAERATQGMDDLETALTKLPELVESLRDRARLLPVAEAALEEARRTIAADPVKALREARRASRAVELADLLPQVRSEIEAGERRIAEVRQELGAALGIDPESLLREADQNPSERLAGAARQADTAKTSLDLGDVDGADSALEEAKRLLQVATAFVDRTLEAGRSWDRVAGERRAETERLAALVPEHEVLAIRMLERFGKSDQTLKSGGLAAVRDAIEAARRNLDAASAALREGRVLAAAALLGQAGAHQEQAGLCLAEIKEELDRLVEEALAAERARQEEEWSSSAGSSSSSTSSSSSYFSSSSDSSSHGDSGSSSSGWSGSDSGSASSSWGSSDSGSSRSGW